MTSPRRRARMEQVLAARLTRVHCAVEALHHRHNLSAILRTCDALGIHNVHVIAPRRPKISAGAARGAEGWLALHHYPDPAAAIASLRAQGIRIVVADLAPDGDPMPPEGVAVDTPVCLWFGAELVGVSDLARDAADGVVELPMYGFAQSLNVSVAAALVLRPVSDAARRIGEAARLPAASREQILGDWLRREHALTERIRLRGGGSQVADGKVPG